MAFAAACGHVRALIFAGEEPRVPNIDQDQRRLVGRLDGGSENRRRDLAVIERASRAAIQSRHQEADAANLNPLHPSAVAITLQ